MKRIWLILTILLSCSPLASAQGALQTVDDFYLRGIQKLTQKDYLGAVSDLERAYEFDSTDSKACRALASALFHAGDMQKSAARFERAVSLDREDWQSAAQLAVIYLRDDMANYDKAITYAELATRLNPSSDLAVFALASAYERSGRLEEAERYYRQFLETFLESPFRVGVANALKKLNEDTFIITYNIVLENQGSLPVHKVEALVMLGRDFADYQKTILVSAEPKFDFVMADSINNKFVEYKFEELSAGEKVKLSFEYLVEIKPTVYEISSPANATPSLQLAPYLVPEDLIECNSEAVVSETNLITTGVSDTYQKARKIYEYVTKTLEYNVQPQSLGAEHALAYPDQADCTEYAALFVALCRASIVPARVIFGFARLPDQKQITSSHAWAEFYLDDFGWTPVDPTYGSRYSEEYFGRIDSDHIGLWSPSPLFRGKWSVIVFHSTSDTETKLFADETADIRMAKAVEPNQELAKLMDFPRIVDELPPLQTPRARPQVLMWSALFFFLILISLLLTRRLLR
jgi:transglutaminase-like putative cysteine protease